jgi:hypothetical protein
MTPEQRKRLEEFLRRREEAQASLLELARSYHECIKAKVDMREHVEACMHVRLMALAENKLAPRPITALLALPDAAVKSLASLPKTQQERLWNDGVAIWRQGAATTVALTNLTAHEARRMVDITNGKGRMLTPEEQATRIAVAQHPPARDQVVEIRLTYEERMQAHKLAQKRGRSVPTLMRDLLREAVE